MTNNRKHECCHRFVIFQSLSQEGETDLTHPVPQVSSAAPAQGHSSSSGWNWYSRECEESATGDGKNRRSKQPPTCLQSHYSVRRLLSCEFIPKSHRCGSTLSKHWCSKCGRRRTGRQSSSAECRWKQCGLPGCTEDTHICSQHVCHPWGFFSKNRAGAARAGQSALSLRKFTLWQYETRKILVAAAPASFSIQHHCWKNSVVFFPQLPFENFLQE